MIKFRVLQLSSKLYNEFFVNDIQYKQIDKISKRLYNIVYQIRDAYR